MRYKIGYPLKSGKESTVFELHDTSEPRQRKVLTLLPNPKTESDLLKLEKSVEWRTHIGHPALPRILDIVFRGQTPGLVTSRIGHPSLETIGECLPKNQILSLALILADLIDQIHNRKQFLGYLTPDQVFIDRNNNLILNFLLPKQPEDSRDISKKSAVFASPEFCRAGKVSGKGDCYCLGAILFKLFTGKDPFPSLPPVEMLKMKQVVFPRISGLVNPDIDKKLLLLIELLLHPDPNLRTSLRMLIPLLRRGVSGPETSPLSFEPPFIGREEELAEFKKIIKNKAESRSSVLISGKPGIGKTRMMSYFTIALLLRKFKIQRVQKNASTETALPSYLANKFEDSGETIKRNNLSIDLPEILWAEKKDKIIFLAKSVNSDTITAHGEFPGCDKGTLSTHHFQLQEMSPSQIKTLLDDYIRDKEADSLPSGYLNLLPGNPADILKLTKLFHDAGILSRESLPYGRNRGNSEKTKQSRRGVGRLIGGKINQAQLITLGLIDLPGKAIEFNRLREMLQNAGISPLKVIDDLKALGLIEIQKCQRTHSVTIKSPELKALIWEGLSTWEIETINQSTVQILREQFHQGGSLGFGSKICEICLEMKKPSQAEEILTSALEYLDNNSFYDHYLLLLELAIDQKLIRIDEPEVLFSYLKALLRTGRERPCKKILKNHPEIFRNRKLLGRLDRLLDSLEISRSEIFPRHSSDDHQEGTSLIKVAENPGTGSWNPFAFKKTSQTRNQGYRRKRESLQERSRFAHSLSNFYRLQGNPGRAMEFELKAFRISTCIGEQTEASRRLLNLAELSIQLFNFRNSESWLRQARAIAQRTGDIKAALIAELLDAKILRHLGKYLQANLVLSRIKHQNRNICGCHHIAAQILLEESFNLYYLSEYEQAMERISRLKTFLFRLRPGEITGKVLLLEARISEAWHMPIRALALIKEIEDTPNIKNSLLVAEARLLKVKVHLSRNHYGKAGETLQKIISRKHLLPRHLIAKIRITQSSYYLSTGNRLLASACVIHALKISRETCILPLKAEACLCASAFLMKTGEKRRALLYTRQTLFLSEKINRLDLYHQAQKHLVRDEIQTGLREPGQSVKMQGFISFLRRDPSTEQIKAKLHSLINSAVKNVHPGFGPEPHGTPPLSSYESEEPEGWPSPADEGDACKERHNTPKNRFTLAFPIQINGSYSGNLLIDLRGTTFLSQSDYQFLGHLVDLVSITSGWKRREIPAPNKLKNNSVTLSNGQNIIAESRAMQLVLDRLISVADKKNTVLLQGESGTGKELLARALHDCSFRKSGPFVAVNCGAFPPELIENELFGHVKGSYTGADVSKPGLFEAASRGTIFLDEISTLPLGLQPRLLRVIESKMVRPIGASCERKIDARIVAASNQDLQALVLQGSFRKDLFFRLNAFRIEIPPLRERKSDIQGLCTHYLRQHPDYPKKTLSAGALRILSEYDFPGNVRELLNILENLICFSSSSIISTADVKVHCPPLISQQKAVQETSRAKSIIDLMASGRTNFWKGVRKPFIDRDINKSELRGIISEGLRQTSGSYKALLRLFGLYPNEYKKFLSFLEHHDCKVNFRQFRPPPGGKR